ncbi:hypothetical protein DFJ58DRAFT_795696 [Suillus subalutaceus]|uniref:uncharacterized protein n=1 Tax=Suillus subalutaceus TaxID=48586 RepID=UPI001B860B76|nr:uncharacterized protein DFJ58DRAFT_795696 [Suillus subalutaceus]KAG1848967.1 hypothetical protein DFJ58DRAFT_795696 [Suillus subalutaceus]
MRKHSLVRSDAYTTTADSLFIAAVTILFAILVTSATEWFPCCDRHYRCCQCNNLLRWYDLLRTRTISLRWVGAGSANECIL